jgi:hypothetical protein
VQLGVLTSFAAGDGSSSGIGADLAVRAALVVGAVSSSISSSRAGAANELCSICQTSRAHTCMPCFVMMSCGTCSDHRFASGVQVLHHSLPAGSPLCAYLAAGLASSTDALFGAATARTAAGQCRVMLTVCLLSQQAGQAAA